MDVTNILPGNRGRSGVIARFMFRAFAFIGIATTVFAGPMGAVDLIARYLVGIGACHIDVIKERPSPGGGQTVIVYQNVCNDIEEVTTLASLAKSVDDFARNHPEPFFSALDINTGDVSVSWRDDGHPVVEIPEGLGYIQKTLTSAGDVEFR